MNRRSFAVWGMTLALGLCASAARVWEFLTAYEPETELTVPWHPATLTTLGISALTVLLIFVLIPRREMRTRSSGKAAAMVLEFLACFALLGSALFDTLKGLERVTVSLLVFAALTLLTVFCLIRFGSGFADGNTDKTRGFYLTIPVFWGCYWLILDFWDHAANPVLFAYFYKMVAIIFMTLALHGAAGLSFDRGKASRIRLYAFAGLFFSMMTLLSTFVTPLFIGGGITFAAMELTPALICRYLFACLQMTLVGLFAADKPVNNEQ